MRFPTRKREPDHQVSDPQASDVRRNDPYFEHGVSGDLASYPTFSTAVATLEQRDKLIIAVLDRLGRATQNMLVFAE